LRPLRDAKFVSRRETPRFVGATARVATNHDTEHSDFQEAIVAATARVNVRPSWALPA
jgi:hypothetical protein